MCIKDPTGIVHASIINRNLAPVVIYSCGLYYYARDKTKDQIYCHFSKSKGTDTQSSLSCLWCLAARYVTRSSPQMLEVCR